MRRKEPHETPPNSFQDAVARTPQLGEAAYRPGLQAIASSYREKIIAEQSQFLGSIDLDAALKQAYSEQPRWDYGIGVQRNDRIAAIWVEFHPAETNKVREVLRKLEWLREWLREQAPLLNEITPQQRAFFWIATNGCHIQSSSPQARLLFQKGLELPRRRLDIDRLDL